MIRMFLQCYVDYSLPKVPSFNYFKVTFRTMHQNVKEIANIVTVFIENQQFFGSEI